MPGIASAPRTTVSMPIRNIPRPMIVKTSQSARTIAPSLLEGAIIPRAVGGLLRRRLLVFPGRQRDEDRKDDPDPDQRVEHRVLQRPCIRRRHSDLSENIVGRNIS